MGNHHMLRIVAYLTVGQTQYKIPKRQKKKSSVRFLKHTLSTFAITSRKSWSGHLSSFQASFRDCIVCVCACFVASGTT